MNHRRSGVLFLTALCAGSLLPLAAFAEQKELSAQARWRAQEIRYTYNGITNAYNCDSAEQRLRAILIALGAHERTQVKARGCEPRGVAISFFITITTATPVLLGSASAGTSSGPEQRALLTTLDLKPDETFVAELKVIDMSQQRQLKLQSGDCELLRGLRNNVLPQLSMKVIRDNISCNSNGVGQRQPGLTVAALVPKPKPDGEVKPKS